LLVGMRRTEQINLIPILRGNHQFGIDKTGIG
jgi:hypothetical protein